MWVVREFITLSEGDTMCKKHSLQKQSYNYSDYQKYQYCELLQYQVQ